MFIYLPSTSLYILSYHAALFLSFSLVYLFYNFPSCIAIYARAARKQMDAEKGDNIFILSIYYLFFFIYFFFVRRFLFCWPSQYYIAI